MNLNLQTPKKQAGFGPFLSGLGMIGSGLFDIMGGMSQKRAAEQGRKDIKGLPGMSGPMGLQGNFGSSNYGNFSMNPQMMALQGMMGGMSGGLLGGGLFNDPRFQQAFQMNDMAGALGQSDAALQQQMGNNAFGGLGGLFSNASQLQNQMQANVMAGPQDFSGGLQGQLFNQASQNLGSFGATQSAELQAMRNAAQPAMNRQFNQLQNRLHSMGMLGSTGGGQQMEGLFNAQNQQDLDFQTQSFQRAMGRQGLGLQQGQAGAALQGQGFNQWNQNFGNALGAGQFMQGLEGQQFGQNLQALQQNQSAGMNRLNQAMGLFGQGADIFGQQFGLGMQGAGGMLDFGQFGLDAASMPYQLQAQLLGAGGSHARALADNSRALGSANSGFFGGLGSAVGGIAKGIKSLFSDKRLKDNLRWVGTDGRGNNWYEWDWNSQAKLVGAHKQPAWGVIAQEVQEYHPEAVTEGPGGFLKVDYEVLYNG